MTLRIRDRGGSPPLINYINLGIRVLQVIFSAAVIGVYAPRIKDAWWNGLHQKLVLAETIGAMSVTTAVILGALPFLVSYYYVAVVFLWDWIIFFIWCAVFATQKKWFSDKGNTDYWKQSGLKGVDSMIAAQWLDLTAMLLFLVSGIMGPVCLLMDRKSLFASQTGS